MVCLAGIAYSQSVVITKRTVTYTRSKPQADHKRTFKVNYPVIKAVTPAVARKIKGHLDYFKLWDMTLQEELNEFQWLEQADFDVKFNDRGILCVMMFVEGSAAYPSGDTKFVVISTKTGNRLRAADLFTDRTKLISKLDGLLQKEIAEAKTELRKQPDSADIDADDLFAGKRFTAASLETFIVTREGVEFYYDYGFPHVIQALEPVGEFKFTWVEIKPFIRRDGLLATFVR